MNTLKKIDKTIYLNAGMLCPKCKVGQLVLKKGNFLGCSEWKLDKTGCNQTYNVTKSEGVEDEE